MYALDREINRTLVEVGVTGVDTETERSSCQELPIKQVFVVNMRVGKI